MCIAKFLAQNIIKEVFTVKKFFALLLVVLMLVPFVVACGGGDETTTTVKPNDNTTTTVNNNNDNTTLPPVTPTTWSSEHDVRNTWAGKTLNIACTSWSGGFGAPWGVMEAVVKFGETSGFGETIDAAVLERNAFIKEKYGVTLNWIQAARYGTATDLESAIVANKVTWDLYMPRALRDQELVASGNLYDMANREFIDFDNTYYNDLSVRTYTAKGHTFFVTGDFSTIDKETASLLWFNKDLLGDKAKVDALYNSVRKNEWTWNDLITLSNGAYSDDGDGVHGDTDTYGLSMSSVNNLYAFFGVTTTGVNQSTGEWELTLNNDRIDDIVEAVITAKTANYIRSAWGGSWGSNAGAALQDGRLLFYNEVIQHTYVTEKLSSGLVPFPMLNKEQGRYYAPASSQMTVLVCIPKLTQDRAMSEYFLDVLGWTGKKYTMAAYYADKALHLESATELEMFTNYVVPNINYDSGDAIGWGSVISGVKGDAHIGNVNNFTQAYESAAPKAQETIDSWNKAWGSYTDA